MFDEMYISYLGQSTDERGLSYSLIESELSKIGKIRDVHIAEIRPRQIRGNHFHSKRGEIIAVISTDWWSLHWDTGQGTEVRCRNFESGAVAVVPPSGWSHAIRNDGNSSLWIFAASDVAYEEDGADPRKRDTTRRVVVEQ